MALGHCAVCKSLQYCRDARLSPCLASWRHVLFTVNLLQRHGNDLLTRHIDLLRENVASVRSRHPFRIHGWVVLREHMHCVLEFPEDDADVATRWRLIKMGFSKGLPKTECLFKARENRGERGIRQRRFWEHLIRDDAGFVAHMDYVHFNPVKHGLVNPVANWPYSTFHRLVKQGMHPRDWGGGKESGEGMMIDIWRNALCLLSPTRANNSN